MLEVLTDKLSGRDLNFAIAERVLGWKRGQRYGNGNGEWEVPGRDSRIPMYWSSTPRFSESIEAAMQVVEKMMELGFRYVMRGNFENNGLHHAAFDHADWADANPLYQSPLGKSLPEAICRAALIALDSKK